MNSKATLPLNKIVISVLLCVLIGSIIGLCIGLTSQSGGIGVSVGAISGLAVGIAVAYRLKDFNKTESPFRQTIYELWVSVRFVLVSLILSLVLNLILGNLFGRSEFIRVITIAAGVGFAAYIFRTKK